MNSPIVVSQRLSDQHPSDYLHRLEAMGCLLFHGSPITHLTWLEPQPATDQTGGAWGNDTAVFAVPAVIAAARAILPLRHTICGTWWIRASRDPMQPGGPTLEVTPNIKLGSGSVYVVNREPFVKCIEFPEWKTHTRIKVLAEVTVTPADYGALGGRIIQCQPFDWTLDKEN